MDITKHVRNILPLPKSWEKDNDLRSFGIRINDAIMSLFSQRNAIRRQISSAVSTATGTAKKITSITLPPGEWMVTGKAIFAANTTGVRGIKVSSSTSFSWSSATVSNGTHNSSVTLNGTEYIKIGEKTEINLLAYQTSGGSLNVTAASITAIRIRT